MYFLDLIKDTVAKHIASLTDIDDTQNNFDESHSELEYTTEGTNNQTTMCNNDLCASTFYNYTPEDETAQGTFLNDEVITIDDTDRLLENCTMEDLEEKLLNKHLNKIYEEYSRGTDQDEEDDATASYYALQERSINKINKKKREVIIKFKANSYVESSKKSRIFAITENPYRTRCGFTVEKCLDYSWFFFFAKCVLCFLLIIYSVGLFVSFVCIYDWHTLYRLHPNAVGLIEALEYVKYSFVALFFNTYLSYRYPMLKPFIFILTTVVVMFNTSKVFLITVGFRICKIVTDAINYLRPPDVPIYILNPKDTFLIKITDYLYDFEWVKWCKGVVDEAIKYRDSLNNTS